MLDTFVNEGNPLGILGSMFMEDGAEVPCPEEGGWRYNGGGVAGEGVVGCEGGNVGIDELDDEAVD